MVVSANKIGLETLKLISSHNLNYGLSRTSKIVWHEISGLTLDQAKEILIQLIRKGYLDEKNVGADFPIRVVELTDAGEKAVANQEEILLDLQNLYTSFKRATDIGIVDADILKEYFSVKHELAQLEKREEELKVFIKQAMLDKNVSELHSDLLDLYCKQVERVTYPKDRILRYVPPDLLDRIREVKHITLLISKLKANVE